MIVQHNDLIEAKQNLTLQEKRIVLWLSSQVRLNDEDFKEHELSIRDFCKIVGVDHEGMYTRLALITKGLMKKVVEIKTIKGKDEVLEQISLLSYVRYQKSLGTVVLSFHPQMRKVLLNLQSNFTKTNLSISLSFSSLYSLRFYELLKKDVFMQVKSFSVQELRDLLCIKTGKYKNYKDFKKRVIDSSIREINEKSDLAVDWVEIKTGRKVTTITCSINKKVDSSEELQSLNPCYKFGISNYSFDRLRKEFSDAAINQGLLSLEAYKGTVKNPILFLRKAIKEGWHPFQDREKEKQKQLKELAHELRQKISLLDEAKICIQIRLLFLEKEGEAMYKSWIQPLHFLDEDESIIVVAKNKFSKNWLEETYAKQFFDYSEGKKIVFCIEDQMPELKKSLSKKKVSDNIVILDGITEKKDRKILDSKKKKTAKRKKAAKLLTKVEVVKKKSLWKRITGFWS